MSNRPSYGIEGAPLALLYSFFQLPFFTIVAMVTRGQTNKVTLLQVFKEILSLEEDSDPIKVLAQECYTDMQGFLSIEGCCLCCQKDC